MFRKVNHNRGHNYWFTLCHIIFTAISGWCWKHCSDLEFRLRRAIYASGIPSSSDPSQATQQFLIAKCLFIYLTVHGALGVLRFGHPQLSLNGAFRKVYEIGFVSLRVLPCTLITAQVYWFYISQLNLISGTDATSSLLFNYDLTYFILGCAAVSVLNDLWKGGYSWIKAVILAVNVVLLVLLGSLDECYWIIFLAVQIVWNSFGLDVISGRYEVALVVYCEVFTIGLSFFDIFAFNSLSELIDLIIVASYDR